MPLGRTSGDPKSAPQRQVPWPYYGGQTGVDHGTAQVTCSESASPRWGHWAVWHELEAGFVDLVWLRAHGPRPGPGPELPRLRARNAPTWPSEAQGTKPGVLRCLNSYQLACQWVRALPNFLEKTEHDVRVRAPYKWERRGLNIMHEAGFVWMVGWVGSAHSSRFFEHWHFESSGRVCPLVSTPTPEHELEPEARVSHVPPF